MKKAVVFLLVIIMALGVFSFSGCNNGKPADNSCVICGDDPCTCPDIPPPEYAEDGALVVFSFESYEALLRSVAFSAAQSKIELSDNPAYVTQGKYCARMRMNQVKNSAGYYDDSTFQLLANTPYIPKADFSDVEYFAIDIYNASGFEVEFIFSYANTYTHLYRSTLKEGANKVLMYADRETHDFAAINIFDFTFKGGEGSDGPLDIYVDNFRVFETEIEAKLYEPDMSGENWFDFSHAAETSYFWYFGAIESIFSRPAHSINRNSNFILTGDSSMRVDFFQKRNGAMDCTGFRTADDCLGDFNKYVGADNWYVAFDVYNATAGPITLSAIVFSNYADETVSIPVITIAPGAWSDSTKARIYVNALKTSFTGAALNIMTVTFSFGGMTQPGSIYFDNIRVTK